MKIQVLQQDNENYNVINLHNLQNIQQTENTNVREFKECTLKLKTIEDHNHENDIQKHHESNENLEDVFVTLRSGTDIPPRTQNENDMKVDKSKNQNDNENVIAENLEITKKQSESAIEAKNDQTNQLKEKESLKSKSLAPYPERLQQTIPEKQEKSDKFLKKYKLTFLC